MAKCAYCHERKGKRACPALHGEICTSCCGEHRGKEIRCPLDCVYFTPHEAYQRERVGELFAQEWHRLSELSHARWGEKGDRLGLVLLLTIYRHFVDQPGAADAEVLSGLGQLRKRLSPIYLPQILSTPFGDLLWKDVEAFLKEVPIDATTGSELLEAYLKMLSDFSGNALSSNRALRGVVGFVQRNFPQAAESLREKETPPGRIVRL